LRVVTFKATSKDVKEEVLNKLDDLHSKRKRGILTNNNNSRAKEQNLLRLLCSDIDNENNGDIDERYQYTLSSIK
jgi:hypothetical protein